MKLERNDLILISGGAFTSTLINSLVKLFTTTIEFGRMIGTTIRRAISKKKMC